MSEDKDTPKDKYKDRKKAESDAAEEISGLADTTSEGFDRLSDNQEDLKEINMAQVDAHEKEHNKLDILLERTREGLDDIDAGTTNNYNLDFSGVENAVKYVGGGLRNLLSWGSDKTEGIDDVDRRKVLAGIGAAAVVDYTNVLPGDENSGDGILRIGECGWDIDIGGQYGEQQQCSPDDNGYATPEGDYTATWDDESISNWNDFVDRVPGQVDEVYTESATGKEFVVVENEENQAFQVGYDELELDSEEEASLETSDNYLEFFEMEE